MAQFSHFDSRCYRTVDVRTGYGEWVAAYERTVEDAMDVALLDALATPPWDTLRSATALACGTGRTGAWLRRRGVTFVDGVDLTAEMFAAGVLAARTNLIGEPHATGVWTVQRRDG